MQSGRDFSRDVEGKETVPGNLGLQGADSTPSRQKDMEGLISLRGSDGCRVFFSRA